MTESQKEYRHIIKATSLFSGVQFLNILFSVIRSKFAAILIGPAGMGIVGVLNATLNLLSGFTKLGLDVSSVKEISAANEINDDHKVTDIISTLNRILWYTGLLGMVLTIVLSSWLSRIAFGNTDFQLSFVWISIAILFKQLTIGNLSALQGLRKLKLLAKANLLASFASVLVVIPLYYFFGLDGIVPVIIINALLTLLIARYFARNHISKSSGQSFKETFLKGKSMMQLGILLSVSSLITLFVGYCMQVYITNAGGIEEVGFYNAGFIIINSYVGLIFNAMGKDYFPRLAAIANQNDKIQTAVLYQASIAVLLITPIIVIFLAFMPFIIELLYSVEFIPIVTFVAIAILGTIFKAVSWSMGYVIIAKGDSKVFIKTAIGFNALLLVLNILGYNYYGLTGLGVSFVVYYIVHFVVLKIITRYRYDLQFSNSFVMEFILCTILCLAAFLLTYLNNDIGKYSLLGLVILIASSYTYYQLHKKINLTELLRKFLNRK